MKGIHVGLLRYSNDAAGVVYIGLCVLVQILAFVFLDNIALLALFPIVTLPFFQSASAVNHNHHHCLTFHSRVLNRLFECVLFFQTGYSPFAWTIHHNVGHHEFYLDQNKDTSAWKAADGRIYSRFEYCLRNSLNIYPEIWRVGKEHPELFRNFLKAFVVCLAILLALIIIDPIAALFVFVIPMSMMHFLTVDSTFEHHSGLDTPDKYGASYTITDRLYNLLAWNLGYHTAHHVRPGLHWSRLPQFHKKICNDIPEANIYHYWPMIQSLKGLVLRPLGLRPRSSEAE